MGSSMKFGRYLAVMVSSWLLAAAVVVGFTLLVDAIGISPVRVAIAGFNTWKPLRQDYDWIVKRYDVRRSQPTTIFMGSSRIKQSIDPKTVRRDRVRSSLQWRDQRQRKFQRRPGSYLQYYLRADKNLHHVFIEAFASALLDSVAHRGATVRRRSEGWTTPSQTEPARRIRTRSRHSGLGVGILLHGRSELRNSHCIGAIVDRNRADGRLVRRRLCADPARAAPLQRPKRFQFRAAHRVACGAAARYRRLSWRRQEK